MPMTIEGTYRNGEIRLSQTPEGVREARVLVTFLANDGRRGPAPAGQISFGMFAGDRLTDEDDFRLAEWRDQAELPNGR